MARHHVVNVLNFSFLPCSATHSADYAVHLPSHLSVCPSITRQYCVEMAKHIIKLFSR